MSEDNPPSADDNSPAAATDVGPAEPTQPGPELDHSPQATISEPSPAAPHSTFAGRFWVTLGFTVIVVVLLIIFIAENSQRVTIHFLGAKGSISAALALLIAAVAGAIIMLLVGTTRILQLRREVKRLL